MKKLTLVSVTCKGKLNTVFVECDYQNGKAIVPFSVITNLLRDLGITEEDHITFSIG
jgi:hypothetical protein